MTCSLELLNPALYEKIGHLLHATLVSAQKQHSHLLTASCKDWIRATSSQAQAAQIITLLTRQTDRPSLLKAVEHILGKLFIPAFKSFKAYEKLLQRVQELLLAQENQPVTRRLEDADSTKNNRLPREDGSSFSSEQTGLLLVDAENMNPPEALEDFLQTIGRYPIRYRLAFGNWCKLGRRDQELYQRGYQMVHVPSGKNSADIKMSLDASLISLRNPSIREVFICSTDLDLLHLGHVLLNLGITPYRVSRHHDCFEIFNLAKQSTQVFHLPQTGKEQGDVAAKPALQVASTAKNSASAAPVAMQEVKIPSLDQMKSWLKILILQEQQANPGQPITVSHLGKLFRDRNQISVNQVLKSNSGCKTLKKFLEAHEGFELSLLPDGHHFEVKLKASATDPAVSTQNAKQNAPQRITNAHDLEQALIKILWNLSSEQAGNQIELTVLGTRFAQVYQEPMSKVLKRIGEPKGLPKFLAKCRSIRTQKKGSTWQLALACVS